MQYRCHDCEKDNIHNKISMISIKSSAVLNYELCKKGYKFEKMTSNYKGIGNKISYLITGH